MNHPLQCRCGTLKGHVAHPEKANRGVCYCKDCRAFARFLGRADDVLDALGGTDVVATLPEYVTFSEGADALACMSLSPNGLLRWYADCCKTPIANTSRNFKLPYAGLVHSCLDASPSSFEGAFGPVRMRVNTKGAKADVRSTPFTTLALILGFSGSLLRARLNGGYRRTPFFDPERGTPVRAPKVLARSERDRLSGS